MTLEEIIQSLSNLSLEHFIDISNIVDEMNAHSKQETEQK